MLVRPVWPRWFVLCHLAKLKMDVPSGCCKLRCQLDLQFWDDLRYMSLVSSHKPSSILSARSISLNFILVPSQLSSLPKEASRNLQRWTFLGRAEPLWEPLRRRCCGTPHRSGGAGTLWAQPASGGRLHGVVVGPECQLHQASANRLPKDGGHEVLN